MKGKHLTQVEFLNPPRIGHAGNVKRVTERFSDVHAAAAQALGHRDLVQAPENPAAEPWPPMRAGIGL